MFYIQKRLSFALLYLFTVGSRYQSSSIRIGIYSPNSLSLPNPAGFSAGGSRGDSPSAGSSVQTAVTILNSHAPITSEKTQTMFRGFDTVSNCCHKLSLWGAAEVPCCFEYNALSNMFSKHLHIHKHPSPPDQIPKRADVLCLRGRRQNANKDSEPSLNSVLTGACVSSSWGWFWCRLAVEGLNRLSGWVLNWWKSFKEEEIVCRQCNNNVIM